MREIEFRGKRMDNGEWIYGNYSKYGKAAHAISLPNEDSEDGIEYGCLVDPETVGQYTGLKDRNGVKIFEGDIVKWGHIEPYTEFNPRVAIVEFAPLMQYRCLTETSLLPKGEWFVSGGFPCQPHSVAGKRKASEDKRDLWPECQRMLCGLRPRIALFENVLGLFVSDGGGFFRGILRDIAESGYDAEWQVISAFDVGAPHLRKRVWIVAYPGSSVLSNTRYKGIYK